MPPAGPRRVSTARRPGAGQGLQGPWLLRPPCSWPAPHRLAAPGAERSKSPEDAAPRARGGTRASLSRVQQGRPFPGGARRHPRPLRVPLALGARASSGQQRWTPGGAAGRPVMSRGCSGAATSGSPGAVLGMTVPWPRRSVLRTPGKADLDPSSWRAAPCLAQGFASPSSRRPPSPAHWRGEATLQGTTPYPRIWDGEARGHRLLISWYSLYLMHGL